MERLITTREASRITGLSEYELRMGARQGRYPVILVGDDDCKMKRMKWNLTALERALQEQLDACMSQKDAPAETGEPAE